MDALHVVRLAEAVDQRLPVARHRHRRCCSVQRKSSSPTHAMSSGTPSRNSASGIGVEVEVDEHQRAPRVDLRPGTAGSRRCAARRSPCATAPRAAGPRGPTTSGGSRSGARSSPSPEPWHSSLPRCRHTFWKARSSPSSPRTIEHRVAARRRYSKTVARRRRRGRRVHASCHTLRPEPLVLERGELRRRVARRRDRGRRPAPRDAGDRRADRRLVGRSTGDAIVCVERTRAVSHARRRAPARPGGRRSPRRRAWSTSPATIVAT